MQARASRLESFENAKDCPFSLKRKTGLTVNKLVDAGFFYTGPSDTVECHLCHVKIDNWNMSAGSESTILNRHIQALTKTCPLVMLVKEGNEWIAQVKKGLRPFDAQAVDAPWSSKMEKARTSTFVNWPHSISPLQMSQAGFVYASDGKGDDKAECFYCHLALDGWEEDDDPRMEHMKRSPDCIFLDHSQLASLNSSASEKKKGKKKQVAVETAPTETENTEQEEPVVETTIQPISNPFQLSENGQLDLDSLRNYVQSQAMQLNKDQMDLDMTVESFLLQCIEEQKQNMLKHGQMMIEAFQSAISTK